MLKIFPAIYLISLFIFIQPRFGFAITSEQLGAEAVKAARLLAVVQNKAQQGYAEGQYLLGRMYRDGYSVAQDNTLAEAWLLKSAAQGYADAQYELGFLYREADNPLYNQEKSLHWFAKAASQGHTSAQVELAYAYIMGAGVSVDYSKALRLFKQAAAANNGDAINNVAWIYATCPDETLRNGHLAVLLMERLTAQYPNDLGFLDTLAASYAEAGAFAEAVTVQRKVIAAIDRKNDQDRFERSQTRLEYYQNRRPWRMQYKY